MINGMDIGLILAYDDFFLSSFFFFPQELVKILDLAKWKAVVT